MGSVRGCVRCRARARAARGPRASSSSELVADQPLRERVHGQLMLALYRERPPGRRTRGVPPGEAGRWSTTSASSPAPSCERCSLLSSRRTRRSTPRPRCRRSWPAARPRSPACADGTRGVARRTRAGAAVRDHRAQPAPQDPAGSRARREAVRRGIDVVYTTKPAEAADRTGLATRRRGRCRRSERGPGRTRACAAAWRGGRPRAEAARPRGRRPDRGALPDADGGRGAG